ncbi:MAG TPA: hypothetical protein VHW69_13735 [Rhizomicrobium sp.]|jgi:hypothetical protein|nr:hypothetical protein [Rhizomicrobium sp.]
MFTRTFGKVLAYLAVAIGLLLLIAFGAFLLECASWGQCPPVSGIGHPAQNAAQK